MRLLIFLTIGLIACNQNNQPKLVSETNTKNSSINDTLESNEINTNTDLDTSKYDISIYNKYISEPLKSILDYKLPDWYLIRPENWDNLWFQYYKSESKLVNYISGDFNCDTRQDYALLLSNGNNEIAVWAIISKDNTYQAIKIHELGLLKTPIQNGLELIPKGTIDYLDLDSEEFKVLKISCDAIQIMYFESAAVAYYWQNGKFESVQTAD